MRSLLGGRLKVDAWRGRCGGRFLTWWTADYRRSGAFALLNAGSGRRPYLPRPFKGIGRYGSAGCISGGSGRHEGSD